MRARATTALRPLREQEPQRLGELAAGALRRAIIAGEFAAGTRLVEEELAAQLRVSRGPIRDALRQLAEEGLVDVVGRGAFVTPPSLHEIWELYTLRSSLECLSIELAVKLFTDADLEAAQLRLDAMVRAAHAGPFDEFVACDMAFHSIFYERINHRRLLRSWQALERPFRTMLIITNANPRVGQVLTLHERILAAVRARDTRQAQRSVRACLAEGQAVLRTTFGPISEDPPT